MEKRWKRFVDTDTDSLAIMMEDAYSKYAKTVGYMYSLQSSMAEREAIFEAERSKDTYLDTTCREVESTIATDGDVKKFVKAIYAIEYPPDKPFYSTFNEETRKLKSFFEWEAFSMKGMWLLLYQAMIDGKPLQSSRHVYRGVSVSFGAEVKQIVAFKQFTSTSEDEAVARDFINKAGKDPRQCTLFDIKISTGLEMDDFFGYDEKEILLMPNDALRVLSVNNESSGLRIISLEQVGSSQF